MQPSCGGPAQQISPAAGCGDGLRPGTAAVSGEAGTCISSPDAGLREGSHDINASGVDGAVSRDVCQLSDVLFYAIKGPGEELTQIALIFSRIPKGQTVNWSKIWNEQALSNAFIKEIERVTPLTNSYFCSCSGVIVTEHCKKESTWQDFLASVKYEPSKAFMDELISKNMATEEQRSAKKEEKAINDLAMATEITTLGFNYWKNLLETALSQKLLTGPEQAILRQAMQIASSGMVPCSSSGNIPAKTLATIKQIFAIRDRLEAEGVSEKPDDSYVKLNITSYNMH